MSFEIGDVVECMVDKASDGRLQEGRKYEVIDVIDDRVVLDQVITRLAPHSWLPQRFKYLGPGPRSPKVAPQKA